MRRPPRNVRELTERATEDPSLETLIPPIVYLPSRLRGKELRLTADNLRLTVDPPTVEENHLRIAKADPIGFLVALMNGQPVPVFEVEPDGSVKVKYEVADISRRENIAKWLAARVTITKLEIAQGRTQRAGTSSPADWDAMVKNRDANAQGNG